jgi:Fur family transcriptional regulator, ferric uptake regulator
VFLVANLQDDKEGDRLMQTPEDYGMKERLKEYGYKFTEQRSSILDVLVQYPDKHLSAEEIYNLVKEKNPEIGLATVYRAIMLMEKLGLVTKLELDDGVSRYELSKGKEDHRHHHLICSSCGCVSEVEDDLLESLEREILLKNGFLVQDHRVKFYGLCVKCRQ